MIAGVTQILLISKRPVGPFGAKPARASAFIGVYTFDQLRKPSVFGIRGTPRGSPRTPQRIGATYTIECRCPCGHREARQGFGVHWYRYTNERRSPCELHPGRPLTTGCCKYGPNNS